MTGILSLAASNRVSTSMSTELHSSTTEIDLVRELSRDAFRDAFGVDFHGQAGIYFGDPRRDFFPTSDPTSTMLAWGSE